MTSQTANNQTFSASLQKMKWWKQERVAAAKVMVIGAGALGNETLKNLTLLGIGHLFIVDFDHIEYPNLSRSILFRESDVGRKKCETAAERIRLINPNVKVQIVNGNITADVGLGIFKRMDVVICCVDNRMARLFINQACHKVDKTWIDGGIQDLGGQMHVYKPGLTCYECSLSTKDRAFIKNRSSCPDIAFIKASQGSIATTPISASIIGALQAQEALKIVFGETENSMTDRSFYLEGRTNEIFQRRYPKKKDYCLSHYEYSNVKTSPLRSDQTVAEALDWLKAELHDENPEILLDNPLILEVTTMETQKVKPVMIAQPHLDNNAIKALQERKGEQLVITKVIHKIDRDFPRQESTLAACGIPPLHIIRVLTDDGRFYVELTDDEDYLHFT